MCIHVFLMCHLSNNLNKESSEENPYFPFHTQCTKSVRTFCIARIELSLNVRISECIYFLLLLSYCSSQSVPFLFWKARAVPSSPARERLPCLSRCLRGRFGLLILHLGWAAINSCLLYDEHMWYVHRSLFASEERSKLGEKFTETCTLPVIL